MTKSKKYKFIDKKQTFTSPLNLCPFILHHLPLFKGLIVWKMLQGKKKFENIC